MRHPIRDRRANSRRFAGTRDALCDQRVLAAVFRKRSTAASPAIAIGHRGSAPTRSRASSASSRARQNKRRVDVAHFPTVLCPIDFSEHSRMALRIAASIADQFGARLTLVTVNDPLLVEATAIVGGPDALIRQTAGELRAFTEQALSGRHGQAGTLAFHVKTGKPAPEILKAARETHADCIVMSTHGLSGFRKAFFGATTGACCGKRPCPYSSRLPASEPPCRSRAPTPPCGAFSYRSI
jgi:nucleotide-binding universal stress UspA family protein